MFFIHKRTARNWTNHQKLALLKTIKTNIKWIWLWLLFAVCFTRFLVRAFAQHRVARHSTVSTASLPKPIEWNNSDKTFSLTSNRHLICGCCSQCWLRELARPGYSLDLSSLYLKLIFVEQQGEGCPELLQGLQTLANGSSCGTTHNDQGGASKRADRYYCKHYSIHRQNILASFHKHGVISQRCWNSAKQLMTNRHNIMTDTRPYSAVWITYFDRRVGVDGWMRFMGA